MRCNKLFVFTFSILFMMFSSIQVASSAERETTNAEWAPFNGTTEEKGSTVVLKATVGGGAFEVAKDNVRIQDNKVEVRIGIDAKIIDQPKSDISLNSMTQSCARQEDCPSKCCACIGLIRVCCGSGGTRGVCLGFWSCPG